MALILHVIIALAGVASSTLAFISPSRTKVYITYGLIVLTSATGTYLVVSTHSPLLSSCLSGLSYLAITLAGIFAAQRKLARQATQS